jgi:hypothetical protein
MKYALFFFLLIQTLLAADNLCIKAHLELLKRVNHQIPTRIKQPIEDASSPVHFGDEVYIDGEIIIHELGSGKAGKVFRVQRRSQGDIFIAKLYQEEFIAYNDVHALLYLENQKDIFPEVFKNFLIPEVRIHKHHKNLVMLENFEGETIAEIMESSMEQAKKDEIYNKYVEALKPLRVHIENYSGTNDIGHSDNINISSIKDRKLNSFFNLFIKADNVLYTKEGKFVIIDPF